MGMQALVRLERPSPVTATLTATLRFEGALDALTAGDVRPRLEQVLAERPTDVVVDLHRVTVLDSTGVGAIVSLFKRLKAQGGQMRVVGAQGQPLAVLKLLKLDRVFGC
jgi:anti-sigma B factor antagonist